MRKYLHIWSFKAFKNKIKEMGVEDPMFPVDTMTLDEWMGLLLTHRQNPAISDFINRIMRNDLIMWGFILGIIACIGGLIFRFITQIVMV